MLHYKIMSYSSDSDWGKLVELISLRDDNDIERAFIRRLNSIDADEPFADKLSEELLSELDHSRRVGEYAVETPLGKGCITCLAARIKFGLMVIEMAKQGSAVITKAGAADADVLEWLSRKGDFTLVLTDNECGGSLRSVMSLINNGQADIEYKGRTYSAYEIRECMEALGEFLSGEAEG